MENPYIKSFEDHIIKCESRIIMDGYVYEMHRHDYIEIELILSGEAEHICNSNLTKLMRGHAYAITSHDHHAFHALSEVKLLNICFDTNILEKDIKDVMESYGKNLYCILDEAQLYEAEKKFKCIEDEQKEKTPLSNAVSRALLTEILVSIIRHSGSTAPPTPSLAQRAISYVHTNFKNPLTISQAAARFSVTPNYLGKVFKSYTGVSFNGYLNEIRLKYACNMLRFSAVPIKDIALMSGYSSVEYFFSIFKMQFGITPKEYRSKNVCRQAVHTANTAAL